MAKIITLTNQKGGVGKTTTTSALAAGLASNGKKVLILDLDPQGNLGFSYGVNIEDATTIYEVLKDGRSIEEAIYSTKYFDIVPSNILLSSAEIEFNQVGREFLLQNALFRVAQKYDYIVIDTPPALNTITVNAYVVSDYLIIPMIPDILSLVGVSQIKETFETVKKFYNPKLEILGILLNRFDKRTILSREVLEMAEDISGQLNTKVFNAKVRASVVVAEAPAHGLSLFDYAPASNPTLDYKEFISEVLDIIK